MSKTLDKMRRNPRSDWTIRQIEVVCRESGLRCDPPRSGSHYKISHPRKAEILTVPFKRPIKAVYIRKLLEFIDDVMGHDEPS